VNDETLFLQLPALRRFHVSDFSCVALNEEFLVIGVTGMVMAFVVTGDCRGRWVAFHEIKDAIIEKLRFSRDGQQLLALTRLFENGEVIEKLFLYSARDLPRSQLERAGLMTLEPLEIKWKADTTRTSRDAVFSRNMTKVAISTNISGSTADIRILAKDEQNMWGTLGIQRVQIFQPDDVRGWHGRGITGISL
jgi:hypothetical protein